MATAKKNILIHAPTEILLRYLLDPSNLLGVYPNLNKVSDVLRITPTNVRFTWELQLLGVHFMGGAEMSEVIRGQELHLHMWGGISGNIWLRLSPAPEAGTLLEVEFEYEVPTQILHKHTHETIIQHNETNIEGFLANLKELIEARMHLQLR